MPQSKQAIRSRIRTVSSIRKITRAMEMIANAKLFKQRNAMEKNREYASRLQSTVADILSENQDIDEKFLRPKKSTAVFTIVFCSDLGLCGGYNSNVLKLARESLNPEDPVVLIGTSLFHSFQEYGFHLVNQQPISSDKIQFMDLKKWIEHAVSSYEADEVGKVQLLYTRFVNTMTFQPALDQLLPAVSTVQKPKKAEGMHQETLFEPDPVTILDSLIPMMIQDVAYADWMESTTAEQGSRRVAMKTATDNADDLSSSLRLEYNKARQAAITQEITEVINGSSAV